MRGRRHRYPRRWREAYQVKLMLRGLRALSAATNASARAMADYGRALSLVSSALRKEPPC